MLQMLRNFLAGKFHNSKKSYTKFLVIVLLRYIHSISNSIRAAVIRDINQEEHYLVAVALIQKFSRRRLTLLTTLIQEIRTLNFAHKKSTAEGAFCNSYKV